MKKFLILLFILVQGLVFSATKTLSDIKRKNDEEFIQTIKEIENKVQKIIEKVEAI